MKLEIDLGQYVEAGVDWLLENVPGVFDAISNGIGVIANGIEGALIGMPPWALIGVIVVLGAWRVGLRFALAVLASLLLIVAMDIWVETASTLALVLTASLIALLLGMPAGILMSRSDRIEMVARPILDFMQTMPPFVYLIPAAMFFGLGKVPGVVATLIFAMPPAVRLTNIGIRHVDREKIEAGIAFGCTRGQLLWNVQLPLALPSIMAGVNQTIMLALSMVVIAAMIGAGGLGNPVLVGIQRLEIGTGFEGGLAVVILAVILDRISQTFGQHRQRSFTVLEYLRNLLERGGLIGKRK